MNPLWAGLCGVCVVVALGCVRAAFTAQPPSRIRGASLANSWRQRITRWPWRRTGLAVIGGVLVGWATGWPVAALLATAAVVGVPILAGGQDAHQLITRLDALASWVRRLADVLASGAGGLEQAIVSSARTAPEPLDREIQALAVRLGTRGLEPALRAFAAEVGDVAADEVVLALILRARAGGRGLVDILDAKARALEADVAARQEIEADRAKPRTDVRAILAITAVGLSGLVLFAHEFLTPFNDLAGQLVMAGIGGLLAASGWWMHLLTRTRQSARLLGPTAHHPAARHRGAQRPPRQMTARSTTEVPQ